VGKINLKMVVRPKFFWATLIVFLLIIAATFYIFKEEEEKLRIFTEEQLAETVEQKIVVEKKLIETVKAKEILQQELVSEKERSLALAEELEDKESQMRLALDRLEEAIVARRQAEAHLIVAMRKKRNLEGELRKLTGESEVIELERIVVSSAPRLAGKVLEVSKEYGFVVVDLGSRNKMRLGNIISIYRNDVFIGSVEVERVEEEFSAAVILPNWEHEEFRENDMVVASR